MNQADNQQSESAEKVLSWYKGIIEKHGTEKANRGFIISTYIIFAAFFLDRLAGFNGVESIIEYALKSEHLSDVDKEILTDIRNMCKSENKEHNE